MLRRLARLVEEHAGELAMTEAVDSGKPLATARSRDVVLAADVLRRVADWAGSGGAVGKAAPVPEPGMLGYPVLAPAGVVGVTVPWAFPLLMAVRQLAPAVAAGDPRWCQAGRADAPVRAAAQRAVPASGVPRRHRQRRHRAS